MPKFSVKNKTRGRRSHIVSRVLESLAIIAVSNNIDSGEFFNSIVKAWKHNKTICKKLVVTCRKKNQHSGIFLFTRGEKLLAQFTIPERILQENDPLKSYVEAIPSKSRSAMNPVRRKRNYRIKDLKQKMDRVNLKAKVLKTPEPRSVFTRFGTQAYVSNVLIADETGTISLSLWNQQIKVSVGDVITIENAKVTMFRGVRQLKLGRIGKLNIVDSEVFPTTPELENVDTKQATSN